MVLFNKLQWLAGFAQVLKVVTNFETCFIGNTAVSPWIIINVKVHTNTLTLMSLLSHALETCM